MEKKPNFFIVGAPKCGTTSLAKWLSQHPQVFFSKYKEPHHFNTDENWIWTKSREKYLKLFQDAKPHHFAIGEGSVFYLNSKAAINNIEIFSQREAKYIVCLRNPIKMVVSLHNQFVVSGKEHIVDFKLAWELSESRAFGKNVNLFTREPKHLDYKSVCLLGQQIERLLETVDRNRVHFVFLEDMKSNPEKAYKEVIHFLNLNAHHKTDFTKENSSKKLRSSFFKKVILLLGVIKIKLRIPFNMGLLNIMEKFNQMSGKYSPMDLELEREIKQHFFHDIELLEKLVQRDLSEWKK
jgi:hypothetical protein